MSLARFRCLSFFGRVKSSRERLHSPAGRVSIEGALPLWGLLYNFPALLGGANGRPLYRRSGRTAHALPPTDTFFQVSEAHLGQKIFEVKRKIWIRPQSLMGSGEKFLHGNISRSWRLFRNLSRKCLVKKCLKTIRKNSVVKICCRKGQRLS